MFFEKWGQWWMGATRQSLPPWIFRGAAPKRLCDDRIAAPRLRLVFHFYPGLAPRAHSATAPARLAAGPDSASKLLTPND
jgi:hypothetical protein